MTYRDLDPNMGLAVASRTVLRNLPEKRENWNDVATRVAVGNLLMHPGVQVEYLRLRDHIAQGRILMSGRHLQHGDADQPTRNLEIKSNCSTGATSFIKFYLLLNGSGVGRSYDDEMMIVDWSLMPNVVCALRSSHPDYDPSLVSLEDAQKDYPNATTFVVPDSREGWAKALELIETLTYEGTHRQEVVIIDFSKVRPAGAPIKGMQNRPSSGPVPTMAAFDSASIVARVDNMPRWERTLRIDHYFAECVVVGGARRSAGMAVKNYRDPGVFDFIKIKQKGGLWTANNSVGVDAEFWRLSQVEGTRERQILLAITEAQYDHGTGEPGIINLDRISRDMRGFEIHERGDTIGSPRFPIVSELSKQMYAELVQIVGKMQYPFIVNPCGEIPLNNLGGYCVIADVVPFHTDSLEQAIDAFTSATTALIRTNRMDSLYHGEVHRTNRIGVGFTGIHEFMWKHFRLTFRNVLDEYGTGKPFWEFLDRARKAVEYEATRYATELNMAVPHTFTTVKPAGTTSKLFALTEGAHLPPLKHYIRWVQFEHSSELIEEYRSKGYPVIDTVPGDNYKCVAIVGFPTEPLICRLDIPEELIVLAGDATMEEQYEWVRLIEKYWLGPNGNQVSYTLKYNRDNISYEQYVESVSKNQPTVRCVSVMPTDDWRTTKEKYGYVPEEPISKEEYDDLISIISELAWIDQHLTEPIDLDSLQCASGACPI